MTVSSLSQNAAGFTVELNFRSGELTVLNQGESARLWHNIPGSVADFEAEGPALPVFARLAAVPSGYQLEAEVIDNHEIELNANVVLPRAQFVRDVRNVRTQSAVEVGDAGWMRWMRVAPVVIRPSHYEPADNRVVTSESMTVRFHLVPDGCPVEPTPDPTRYWSLAYEEFFQATLLNPDSWPHTLPGGGIVQRGTYLIICDEYFIQLSEQFAEWKRCKGFNVHIEPMWYGTTSAEDIKAYIQDAYDNWTRPPEFVLIIGDINMPSMKMPSFRIQNPDQAGERDVTDQPYVYLKGEDYFPDAFIGRVSSDSGTTSVVRNYFQRVLDYEKQTYRIAPGAEGYVDYIDRFHRATIFAGNFGDQGRQMLSPVETCQWLAERLLDRGWDVETFYYRGRQGDTRDSEPIRRSINRGVNVVAYRGWGDANGTHYPLFHKNDLEQLDNGPHLPVFTFFVCNTGDFGNDVHPVCFGEYSIYQGSRNRPAGGTGFFGPSDLHTSTRFNNPMLAGYYTALMDLNLRTLGALTLNGKMEVWNGFPLQRIMGAPQNNHVEFYFDVYNILGDPELGVFFDPPTIMTVDVANEVPVGTTNIPFRVRAGNRPVAKAMVNVKHNDEWLSILTDLSGCANVPVSLTEAGEVSYSVIAKQAVPVQDTIAVVPAQNMLGIASVEVSNPEGDDRVIAGVPIDFTVSLKNYGSNPANDVHATLYVDLTNIEVNAAEVAYGNIAAGAEAAGEGAFRVTIAPNAWPWTKVPYYLSITDDAGHEYTAQFRLPNVNAQITYKRLDFIGGLPRAGGEGELTVELVNYGNYNVDAFRAELYSFDNAIEVTDAEGAYPALARGESAANTENTFRIRFGEQIVNGRHIAMHMDLYNADEEKICHETFSFVFGQAQPSDPLGPDSYGYYIYEDADAERFGEARPVYDWLELDPDYEGEYDQRYPLVDDSTIVISLPFSFTYYGDGYDVASICSNGWFSFVDTWMYNFRNWQLPSPLGPHTLVAPYWEDLVGQFIGGGRDSINVFTRYDQEQGRFIIEWSRAVARDSNEDHTVTFEVILYDPAVHATPTGDGEIVFQYHDWALVDNQGERNYATVGMEDYMHFRGLTATYAGEYADAITPLGAGRALKITTIPADPYLNAGKDEAELPVAFGLQDVYPNPFNSVAAISFGMERNGIAALSVWDLQGRMVAEIANGFFQSGRHSISYNAESLPSGLYFIRLASGGMMAQRKVVLLK